MPDDHYIPGYGFKEPFSKTTVTQTQYYRFRDKILNDEAYYNLMGPLTITRTTDLINGVWTYTVEKSGQSSSINM
jgi:hypothetical protein